MSAPYLLAIECSGPRTGAALLRGEALVAEAPPAAGPAAEALLPALDALLAEAGVGLDAIDAFALSVGPGSFTGLRIGVATVKGLAFGSDTPVVAVPTLAALAAAVPDAPEPVISLLDARRGELFAAAWSRRGEDPHPSLPEGVYTRDELALRLPAAGSLVGEGASQLVECAGAAALAAVAAPADAPSAAHVGRLALRLLARGAGVDASQLVPRYGRRAEAEARRTGLR